MVEGVTGTVTKVTVAFTDLDSSDNTRDLSFMLQGPGGQTVRLMNEAGGDLAANNINITFDDEATSNVPTPLASAAFKPTDNGPADFMDPPAPPPPYGNVLSVFNGVPANGTWKLFVEDYEIPGQGSIKAWELKITTVADPTPQPDELKLNISAAKQKLGRKLELDVDTNAAGELLFTGKGRGSVDVPKGESTVDARLDPGAFKKLQKKVKKGKKASVLVEATLKAEGGGSVDDSAKVKIKPKKK